MPPTVGQGSASELFGEQSYFGRFLKNKTRFKALSQIVEDEVASYRLADSISVDANPFMWWKTNEFPHVAKAANVTSVSQGLQFLVKESSPLLGTSLVPTGLAFHQTVFLTHLFAQESLNSG